MNFIDAMTKAISEGKTESQFAIPDGKYMGDLFFITDVNNKILIALGWSGERWIHQFENINVEYEYDYTRKNTSPKDLNPIKMHIKINEYNPKK